MNSGDTLLMTILNALDELSEEALKQVEIRIAIIRQVRNAGEVTNETN